MLSVIWPEEGVVDSSDRGLAYGDGLFETIRVMGSRAFLLERHLQRLIRDAQRLSIPLSRSRLDAVVETALETLAPKTDSGSPGWVLKLILTRGSGGRGYRLPETVSPRLVVSAHSLPPRPDPGGVLARISQWPLVVSPGLAGIKSLNRLDQVMASRELQPGDYEVIMPDLQGDLVEGTRTNLLVRCHHYWVTPAEQSLAVAGVMRGEVLEALEKAGEKVLKRPVSRADLDDSNCLGVWLMNSVAGAVPVRQLGEQGLPVDDGLATIAPLVTGLDE